MPTFHVLRHRANDARDGAARVLRRVKATPSVERQLLERPLTGFADSRWSVIGSAVDQPATQRDLIELSLEAATGALDVELTELAARCDSTDAAYIHTWPGEHYRLLASLAQILQPRVVLEIGTFRGHGSLALAAGAPLATVATYDLIPWKAIEGTILRDSDMASPQTDAQDGLPSAGVVPLLGDLLDHTVRERDAQLLAAADLIFLDGPKDTRWEQRFVGEVLPMLCDRPRLMVVDDIRLLAMVQLWRDLPYPKFDVTSLGHWSGTGLVALGGWKAQVLDPHLDG